MFCGVWSSGAALLLLSAVLGVELGRRAAIAYWGAPVAAH
jgi:hypothetical protein